MKHVLTSILVLFRIWGHAQDIEQGFEEPGSPCFGNYNLPQGWSQVCSNNAGVFSSDCSNANNWIWIHGSSSGPVRTGTHAFTFASTGTSQEPANVRYLVSPLLPSGSVEVGFFMKTNNSFSCGDRQVDLLYTTAPPGSVTDASTWTAWSATLQLIGEYSIPSDPSCTGGCVGDTQNWMEAGPDGMVGPGGSGSFYLVWRYNYSTNNQCTPPIWLDDISISGPSAGIVEDHSAAALQIVPNPSAGQRVQARVEMPLAGQGRVTISDFTGREVLSQPCVWLGRLQQIELELPKEMPAGTYLVSVSGEHGHFARERMIIQ